MAVLVEMHHTGDTVLQRDVVDMVEPRVIASLVTRMVPGGKL